MPKLEEKDNSEGSNNIDGPSEHDVGDNAIRVMAIAETPNRNK